MHGCFRAFPSPTECSSSYNSWRVRVSFIFFAFIFTFLFTFIMALFVACVHVIFCPSQPRRTRSARGRVVVCPVMSRGRIPFNVTWLYALQCHMVVCPLMARGCMPCNDTWSYALPYCIVVYPAISHGCVPCNVTWSYALRFTYFFITCVVCPASRNRARRMSRIA